MITFLCLLFVLLFAHPVTISPDDNIRHQDELIRIAVMDLAASGEMAEVGQRELNELFAGAIAETAIFQVAERADLDRVMEELTLQRTGFMDEQQLVQVGKMINVEYLLFGTIGKLFGRVVLAAKMVDIEKGRIVLARTLTSDEDRFFSDLSRFAVDIASAAVDLTLKVSHEMIEAAIEEGDFPRAKQYLDRYVAEEGIDAQARLYRDRIIPDLARSYAASADRFRRDKKYQEALNMIQRAIALQIDESSIALRDRILREEEKHLERERIAEEKSLQRAETRRLRYERMLEEGQTSIVAAYLSNLSVLGHHLGIVNEWPIDSNYSLPGVFGLWGLEYLSFTDPFGITDSRKEYRGTSRVNRIAYAGLTLFHDTTTESGNNLVKGEMMLSPYTARGFKIVNTILLLGVDIGMGISFSRDLPGGYDWNASAGFLTSLELKIKDTLGFYAMIRCRYEWYPDNQNTFSPVLRASAGIVL